MTRPLIHPCSSLWPYGPFEVREIAKPPSEIRIKARSVSRGIAVGKIVSLYGSSRQFFRTVIDETSVQSEIRRFRRAIETAKRELSRIISRRKTRNADSSPAIFDSQRMLVNDSSLVSKVEAEITNNHFNAEWALRVVTEEYVSKYKAFEDQHLRDRYVDIEDVSERILVALGSERSTNLPFEKNSILAAVEVRPSTLVEFAGHKPDAIITENGGWTSHASILAREMGVPAVTGVKKVLRSVRNGDTAIVDGFHGTVILNPTPDTLAKYLSASKKQADTAERSCLRAGIAETLDGEKVQIYSNAETRKAYAHARSLGSVGIGLYRTEALFNKFHNIPTEREQFVAYRDIAKAVGDHGVKIRTFDIAADQFADLGSGKEKNPALGLRAVRLGLTNKRILKTQIRALLRASHEAAVDIVLPMISGVSEIIAVRQIIDHEAAALTASGRPIGSPKVGVMIEVPSAVLLAKEIIAETDFICLGTNDLIQYLLAADRDNEAVADWYHSLHPAVLRALEMVNLAAKGAGKPVIVCGEMAGSPYYVPVLLGLGFRHLSMNVNSIVPVANLISGIAIEETLDLVKEIASSDSTELNDAITGRHIKQKWSHLMPTNFDFRS